MTTDLRTYDQAEAGRLYQRYGVDERMYSYISCPTCRCTKSGEADVANSRTEACDDSDCRCHDDA